MNDLDDMLKPGVTEEWITKKPPRAWRPGDRVFFWKSAPALRLIGLGRLGGLLRKDRKGFTHVRLRYLTSPFDRPLEQDDLRRDRLLAQASFLKKGPAGTVPVTPAQAPRLLEKISAANPDLAELCAGWRDQNPEDAERTPRGFRTLSVKQPWAWAILHAGKDVENRPRLTNIRGRIRIHASASPPTAEALKEARRILRVAPPDDLPTGVILGSVEIVDCCQGSPSPWAAPGKYPWILAEPRTFARQREASGQRGFWYSSP